MKSKLRIAYMIYVVLLVLTFAGVLVASRSAAAQALATPTSPYSTPTVDWSQLICSTLGPTPGLPTPTGGGSWWVCNTATPIGWQTATPPPTMTLAPTSPHNTAVPYPGPCGPYPCPAVSAPRPWWYIFLPWMTNF